MISRTRERSTPSRSIPPSTSRSLWRSSAKPMATLSCSTRAADLPSAIMIRPQLGSWPLMAVFTSGELATLRAATSAARRLAAPRTVIETSLVAPSPSCTSIRASRPVSASTPAATSPGPRPPPSTGAFSGRAVALRAGGLNELGNGRANLVPRQRVSDDAGGADQQVGGGDPQQVGDLLDHLARLLEAALAVADVRAAAVHEDRLQRAAARVLHGHEHGRALDLVGREHRRRARGRRRVDQREVLPAGGLDAGRDAAGEDAGDGRDAAFEPLD